MQKVFNRFYTLFVVLLLFKSTAAYADEQITQAYIDSVSLSHFELGNWDDVISTGKIAEKNDIDFKRLQQRIGYAYFMKMQYYKSIRHYENALKYDALDEITHLYLYYNGSYTGNITYARYHAGKLSDETKEYIMQKKNRPLDAIDLEISYKIPEFEAIHHAIYTRLGLNSMMGYQFNIYQTFSNFKQSTDTTQTTQNEYFALLDWTPQSKTTLSLGYHYVGSKVFISPTTYKYPGNILFGKISQGFNRINISVTGASFLNEWIDSRQLGVHAGIGFAGKNNIYLSSSYYRILETNTTYQYWRNVFKQTAGIYLFNYLWAEASVNVGNLNHFIDNNGLYIYNSLDPTTFRTGLSLFGYVSKPLTVYLNYTFDEKLVVSSNQQYNQHSITGGLIWKI
jgi:hypothetical protein